MRLRLRPRTIRTQLLALLLVPMISLAALWTYGSYTTLNGALALIRVNATDDYYGRPADALTRALQDERDVAVEYDASNGALAAGPLKEAEKATDARAAVLSSHLRRRATGAALSTDQRARVADVLTAITQLPELRATVNTRNTNWSDILDQYSTLIEPDFQLRTSLTELQTGEVARRGAVVVELGRARELLAQEDAMVLGGRGADGMTDGQYRNLIGAIDGRQLLHEIYEPELPTDAANKLEDFEDGSVGWSLQSLEQEARSATPLTIAAAFPPGVWQRTADTALRQLGSVDVQASRDVDAQAHSMGLQVMLRSVGVLLAGLLAVIASLLISLRIGRRIAARLTGLRDAAEELSGRRLPEMMRRLREGDPVEDVAATALPEYAGTGGDGFVEDFGADEIGQVGRAFGVAQRAAVQAAVEQARLRRGVAAIFTTIARRSQVLLHRQLALLDSMERRTEDPDDLADLYRLDHMTNRIRRHAEGLLILSGLNPGRAWRRPVRMAEVVRSAVGEVERYERITVRRMPEVALAGAAVADVLHLLAELMENATSFSPPDTDVVVRGGRVASGFAIEIEDRGLGMNAVVLAEANQAIQDAAERVVDRTAEGVDLPETDRLGLFIVGRLSARQGVRVTLRRTPREGTTAVVLVPEAALTEPAEPSEPDHAGAAPGDRRRAVEGRHERVGSVAAAATAGAEREPRTPVPSTPADHTTASGLPRRVPSRGLAPRLRAEAVAHDRAAAAGDTADGVNGGSGANGSGAERTPEAARSVAAAYANGLARGRADSGTRAVSGHGERGTAEEAEVAVDAVEHGGTAAENTIDMPVAGEKAPQEDGGPAS